MIKLIKVSTTTGFIGVCELFDNEEPHCDWLLVIGTVKAVKITVLMTFIFFEFLFLNLKVKRKWVGCSARKLVGTEVEGYF